MERNNMTRMCITGSGFVGERVGRGLISLGHDVIFYDIADKNLDLSYIDEATKNIGIALALRQNYHAVVVKSTVVPKTTENVVIPILEKYSGKNAGEFGVCMNPEFLTEIESSWTENKDNKKDICKELSIDSYMIADIVGLDPRIGKYGTVHGKAFGGKCLPKDLKAFVSFAKEYKEAKLLKAVDEVNKEIRKKYGVRE
jgi:UDP-glucose 6-dehydrogenase